MSGTILFGIDVESASPASAGFARFAREMFEELEIPVTWFVTGKTLAAYPDSFRPLVGHPLIELQSHTFQHILLKTVALEVPEGLEIHNSRDWFVKRGEAPETIDADLGRCQDLFERILGRRATALTGPWGYYRGLADRPDLLDIVQRHGFRALRTWARDARDGQPVPLSRQPFFYRAQGFPHVLECPIQNYQDEFYWRAFACPKAGETYTEQLRGIADAVAAGGLVWGLCSHDHAADTREHFDARNGWFREIVAYAKDLGIRFLTISQYYQEALRAKGGG